MTAARVRDLIARLHQHGIKGVIYWNPTEAWCAMGGGGVPDHRVVLPNGKFLPEWYESVKMRADLTRPGPIHPQSTSRGIALVPRRGRSLL